ncbi:hypothetical protein MMC29_007006 [Sticta canariensis]|nr:hypothetical protein [Sticta canariensis]
MLWTMVVIPNTIAHPALFLSQGAGEAELYEPPPQNHSLGSANVRRQNSWAGNMPAGGIRGAGTAGIMTVGDQIVVELTGNDRDQPPKSDDRLEEERKKKE